jgi:hypothetical protein
MVLRLCGVETSKKLALVINSTLVLGLALAATCRVTSTVTAPLLGMGLDKVILTGWPGLEGAAAPFWTDTTVRVVGRAMVSETPRVGVGPAFLTVT